MPTTVLVCDCQGSQRVGIEEIEKGAGVRCSRLHTALCTTQLENAAKAISKGDTVIACQQESQLFRALADEIGAEEPGFVDIRDRAGWTEAGNPGPKQAALVAEALLPAGARHALDVVSDGVCLVCGPAAAALPAAERLAGVLSVTVLLTDDADVDPPVDRRFDVIRGNIRRATGALGGFEVGIDGLRQINPGGRGAFGWSEPRDGARSECDLILDLRGTTPLFTAHEKREGYLRPDPADQSAVAGAIFEAGQMVGTFEKPLYVRLEEALCAHARAGQTGCHKCLDICPTGAITPDGDHVAIDPMICAGCGACAAVCPSGAVSYDFPPVSELFSRIQTLATAYRRAGGAQPRLLVHDTDHGAEMISLAARFGAGLPVDVIPLGLDTVSGFGHAEMLAALACGFGAVDVLLSPRTERDALDGELALAEALGGTGRLRLLELTDPEALPGALGLAGSPETVEPILPIGSRRQVARLAAKALNPGAEAPLPLPEGAPYGAVVVDQESCTLCQSCASLCPAGALGDNPDKPQLRFQEDACLQCGLCETICPENAISLVPRLDLSDAVYTQTVVNEEEPYECVECGKPFGVRSTIERIVEQLEGKHSMFATSDAARMIRMCDNCRIGAQFHSEQNPFASKERPKPRTTDDYFSRRKDH